MCCNCVSIWYSKVNCFSTAMRWGYSNPTAIGCCQSSQVVPVEDVQDQIHALKDVPCAVAGKIPMKIQVQYITVWYSYEVAKPCKTLQNFIIEQHGWQPWWRRQAPWAASTIACACKPPWVRKIQPCPVDVLHTRIASCNAGKQLQSSSPWRLPNEQKNDLQVLIKSGWPVDHRD